MTGIMSILPSIHVSSFMKKYEELLKLSQDPEKCDGQTDRAQTISPLRFNREGTINERAGFLIYILYSVISNGEIMQLISR